MSVEQPGGKVVELVRSCARPKATSPFVVMVHPCDGFVSQPCVRAAAGVARATGGEVLGLASWPTSDHEPQLDGLAETANRRFKEVLREAGAKGRWRPTAAMPMTAVQAYAHEADLIVTARQQPALGRDTAHVGALLRATGRPVYLCAKAPRPWVKRVIVCWNDSAQIRRAVVDALPLLRPSLLTLVVMVGAPRDARRLKARSLEVERGLRDRGVIARALVRISPCGGLAEAVDALAEEVDADLVVAGAYGRSPAVRALGRSRTDALMQGLDRPMLLSR